MKLDRELGAVTPLPGLLWQQLGSGERRKICCERLKEIELSRSEVKTCLGKNLNADLHWNPRSRN